MRRSIQLLIVVGSVLFSFVSSQIAFGTYGGYDQSNGQEPICWVTEIHIHDDNDNEGDPTILEMEDYLFGPIPSNNTNNTNNTTEAGAFVDCIDDVIQQNNTNTSSNGTIQLNMTNMCDEFISLSLRPPPPPPHFDVEDTMDTKAHMLPNCFPETDLNVRTPQNMVKNKCTGVSKRFLVVNDILYDFCSHSFIIIIIFHLEYKFLFSKGFRARSWNNFH